MKMKLSHMKVLREIQAICKKEKTKGGCCESCPFSYSEYCLFIMSPKHWELDEFEVEG